MRAKKEPVCGSLYADARVEKAVHRSLSSWAPVRPLYMVCGRMESLCWKSAAAAWLGALSWTPPVPSTQKVQNSVPKHNCVTAEARDLCTWHVAAWKACVGNDLRPHGCGKPVAAMACGRWLWKACGCNGLWPLLVESLSSWGLLPRAVRFSGTVSADRT